jgi:phenolic acid decarboxylase
MIERVHTGDWKLHSEIIIREWVQDTPIDIYETSPCYSHTV